MSKFGNVYDDQREFLEGAGVAVPPTFAAAQRMIDFIKDGNATIGGGELPRIAVVKTYEVQWMGKRVRRDIPGRGVEEGIVIYLFALSYEEIRHLAKRRSKKYDNPIHPFQLAVRWPGRPSKNKISAIDINRVRLTEGDDPH